jgi:hypothetical protein
MYIHAIRHRKSANYKLERELKWTVYDTFLDAYGDLLPKLDKVPPPKTPIHFIASKVGGIFGKWSGKLHKEKIRGQKSFESHAAKRDLALQ